MTKRNRKSFCFALGAAFAFLFSQSMSFSRPIHAAFNDYDGDGKTDLAVYKDGYWSIYLMAGSVLLNNAGVWGGPGWTPVPGDYDGDGKSDLAVYKDGYWSILTMSLHVICDNAGVWGGPGWIPVPGDYDGDGKADLAVYRNGYWSILTMKGHVICNDAGVWGGPGWIPVPGDYDGDGKSDLAVYRDGYWSILTMAGKVICNNAGVWGGPGWTPVPGDYDGDGKADLAVYRDGYWSIFTMAGKIICNNAGVWGGTDSIPVPGDYDGDGVSDLAVYNVTTGKWSIYSLAKRQVLKWEVLWGFPGIMPVISTVSKPYITDSSPLPSGTVDEKYTPYTFHAVGGTTLGKGQGYSFTKTIGSAFPPMGLIIGPLTGILSGTPKTKGTYTFSVDVKDLGGRFSSKSFTLVINAKTSTKTSTISLSASPSAGGTVDGGGTFASGSSRTVTAKANSGYTFANWTESGVVVSSSASYTFTLNNNRNLVANFVSDSFSLEITSQTWTPIDYDHDGTLYRVVVTGTASGAIGSFLMSSPEHNMSGITFVADSWPANKGGWPQRGSGNPVTTTWTFTIDRIITKEVSIQLLAPNQSKRVYAHL